MSKKTKLVVLISSYGTNLQTILDACASNQLPAEVIAVISNNVDAYGLERARLANIPAHAKVKQPQQTRADYDAELATLVANYQPDLIVLAGWMRLLSLNFLRHFPHRIINLHPALPGAFPGTQAVERAFAAYQRGEIQETGVMVHWVPDEGVDCGPVIEQSIVPIYSTDTLDSLDLRIHQIEQKTLITAINKIINNKFNI